jgi:hypothetical protein
MAVTIANVTHFALLLFLAAANARPPHAVIGRVVIGRVVIERGKGPEPFILITVDALGEDGRGDGAIDFVYKFYTDGEAPDLHYSFPVAHIDDLDDRVVVISAPVEKVHLTFANRDQQVTPRSNDGTMELAFTNGIGIARYWGPEVASACNDN